MIGFLRGRLIARHPPQLLIDVQGVGYELDAPMTTFYELPENGSEVTLYTHLAVREDAHTLYGFAKLSERGLFRNLIRINGVGPRLALAILSSMNAEAFIQCINLGDSAALTRIPGVGKKTAERLVIELRDRLADSDSEVAIAVIPGNENRPANAVEEAVSALVALGYKPQEASRMVRGVEVQSVSSEEIIRQALQGMVR